MTETLSPESYLLGIREVPSSWPEEALKTQAVAARTYLAFTLSAGRTSSGERFSYDICATTACQVYRGHAELGTEGGLRWSEAVTATAGEILLYNGRPAQALYSSTAGPRTRESEDIFPGLDVPYLGAVDSPGEDSPFVDWRFEVAETRHGRPARSGRPTPWPAGFGDGHRNRRRGRTLAGVGLLGWAGGADGLLSIPVSDQPGRVQLSRSVPGTTSRRRALSADGPLRNLRHLNSTHRDRPRPLPRTWPIVCVLGGGLGSSGGDEPVRRQGHGRCRSSLSRHPCPLLRRFAPRSRRRLAPASHHGWPRPRSRRSWKSATGDGVAVTIDGEEVGRGAAAWEFSAVSGEIQTSVPTGVGQAPTIESLRLVYGTGGYRLRFATTAPGEVTILTNPGASESLGLLQRQPVRLRHRPDPTRPVPGHGHGDQPGRNRDPHADGGS